MVHMVSCQSICMDQTRGCHRCLPYIPCSNPTTPVTTSSSAPVRYYKIFLHLFTHHIDNRAPYWAGRISLRLVFESSLLLRLLLCQRVLIFNFTHSCHRFQHGGSVYVSIVTYSQNRNIHIKSNINIFKYNIRFI